MELKPPARKLPTSIAMPRAAVVLAAVALVGTFAWQAAFVQTTGAGAKVGRHGQFIAQGQAPDMAEVKDEGATPFMSLGFGIMAGLLVAVAGASPALAQRNQFGFDEKIDPEVKKLDAIAKPTGLLSELGKTKGDPRWEPLEKVEYEWGAQITEKTKLGSTKK